MVETGGHGRDVAGKGRPTSASESDDLIRRAQAGDRTALSRLFSRHLPWLTAWARGRLPRWARGVVDTADLVQDTLMHTLQRIGSFEPRGQGALRAYLKQALLNRIRDELRQFARQPGTIALSSVDVAADLPSPLRLAISAEQMRHYHAALAALTAQEQQLIAARVHLGYSYDQVALAVGKPSPAAARIALRRAVVRLTELMEHASDDGPND